MGKAFYVKDCAAAVMSTGESASSIIELKEVLTRIPQSSLYFHFWGRHFRTSFSSPEFHNDFARWTHTHLRDFVLAERLGIIDPTEYATLSDLRKVLIDVIEDRLDEIEYLTFSSREEKFHFLRSATVVFETPIVITHPAELKTKLPTLTLTSIFYHFIDAKRRTQTKSDDFSSWLAEEEKGEYAELLKKIQHIDPYFSTLTEIKQKLTELFTQQFA